MLGVVSSKWLHDFYYSSSTKDLHYKVNDIYSRFFKAGDQKFIMKVDIMLDQVFFISNNVVMALKLFAENF